MVDKNTRNLIVILVVLFVMIVLGFAIYYVHYLNVAHSTFDDYYRFRGCTELINKTDTYGFCRTGTGETIKIVKFNEKWYLDGDLPVSCGFFECP